jgi:preprotein translocase subunit SecG
MATETPFDFNRPGYPGDPTAGFDAPPPQRPGGLTAVCVIAIVLGALGLCFSVLGVASLAFQDQLQKFVKQQQHLPPGMANGPLKTEMEARAKMQERVYEAAEKVTHRHMGASSVVLVLNLLISASLLAGAIATLKLSPKGRQFLIAVFLAAILFEIVRGIVLVLTQLDMAAELSAIPSAGSGSADVPLMMARITAILSMVLWLALALGMVVFYGIGASYLRRPTILPLFERPVIDRM